jgi:hypothetical protein
VNEACVELQRRVAGNMAVLATRMLEDLLHGGEGRKRGFALVGPLVRGYRAGSITASGEGEAGEQSDQNPSVVLFVRHLAPPRESRNGRSRSLSMRRPRWPTADATRFGGVPGSPAPPDFQMLYMHILRLIFTA